MLESALECLGWLWTLLSVLHLLLVGSVESGALVTAELSLLIMGDGLVALEAVVDHFQTC